MIVEFCFFGTSIQLFRNAENQCLFFHRNEFRCWKIGRASGTHLRHFENADINAVGMNDLWGPGF